MHPIGCTHRTAFVDVWMLGRRNHVLSHKWRRSVRDIALLAKLHDRKKTHKNYGKWKWNQSQCRERECVCWHKKVLQLFACSSWSIFMMVGWHNVQVQYQVITTNTSLCYAMQCLCEAIALWCAHMHGMSKCACTFLWVAMLSVHIMWTCVLCVPRWLWSLCLCLS